MAEDKKAETPKAEKKVDLVSEIGTLTYPRAVQHFGKDRAIEVMQRVAAIGGHGLFEEDELKSPLFGGLAMPAPEKVIAPRREDFDKFTEAEFYYQAAMEDYEVAKVKAGADLVAINTLYTDLKANS